MITNAGGAGIMLQAYTMTLSLVKYPVVCKNFFPAALLW